MYGIGPSNCDADVMVGPGPALIAPRAAAARSRSGGAVVCDAPPDSPAPPAVPDWPVVPDSPALLAPDPPPETWRELASVLAPGALAEMMILISMNDPQGRIAYRPSKLILTFVRLVTVSQ